MADKKERAAATTATTLEDGDKSTKIFLKRKNTNGLLAQSVRLFDGITDTEGRGGTRTILHLLTDFTQRDDVRKRCEAARADKAAKSKLYACTYAHKGSRESGTEISPTGLLPLDFDNLNAPDSFTDKVLASGAAFCKPSVRKGYHIAYMYDPKQVEYKRALKAAITYAQYHTGELVDTNATNDVRAFFISDKTATIAEEGILFDLALIEWIEANLQQQQPAPQRTTKTTKRVSKAAAKMQGFLEDVEFYYGSTPDDGSWNTCLRKFAEKVAGAGIDRAEAIDWAREVFQPTKQCEKEFTSMFQRAYKEVEGKEAKKMADIIANGYEFARIGGVYYRIADGSPKKWQQKEVHRNLGKDWERKVLYLDGGFTHIPDNVNYRQQVDNCWNLQKPTPQYEVKTDHCNTILKLVSHIAKLSSTADVLLDYLQIAYKNPAQKLPVVVLTSKEQGTGKSTFFQLINLMFGGNTFIGAVDDISGNFTAGWAHSQMICLEESSTDRKAQNDRIKYLTTTTQIKYEPKGVDPIMTPFFGKILIANNNEDSPVYLQDTDQRYMVLRVDKVAEYNPALMTEIKEEMGFFLQWITTQRELTTENKSRLWFEQSIIETDATVAAKEAARPIAEIVIDAMKVCVKSDYPDTMELAVRPASVKAFTFYLGYEYNQRSVCAALKRKGRRKGVKNAQVFEFHMGSDNWELETLIGTNYVYLIKL